MTVFHATTTGNNSSNLPSSDYSSISSRDAATFALHNALGDD